MMSCQYVADVTASSEHRVAAITIELAESLRTPGHTSTCLAVLSDGLQTATCKRDPSIYGDKVEVFASGDVCAVNVDAPGL